MAAIERHPEGVVEPVGAARERPYPGAVAGVQLRHRVAVGIGDPDVAAVERHPVGFVEPVGAAGEVGAVPVQLCDLRQVKPYPRRTGQAGVSLGALRPLRAGWAGWAGNPGVALGALRAGCANIALLPSRASGALELGEHARLDLLGRGDHIVALDRGHGAAAQREEKGSDRDRHGRGWPPKLPFHEFLAFSESRLIGRGVESYRCSAEPNALTESRQRQVRARAEPWTSVTGRGSKPTSTWFALCKVRPTSPRKVRRRSRLRLFAVLPLRMYESARLRRV